MWENNRRVFGRADAQYMFFILLFAKKVSDHNCPQTSFGEEPTKCVEQKHAHVTEIVATSCPHFSFASACLRIGTPDDETQVSCLRVHFFVRAGYCRDELRSAVIHLAVLLCIMLCCAVLCCAVLCCAVLCCAVLCCAVLCCAVLCCAVLCCAALCCLVLHCAVACCCMLCCILLFCRSAVYCGVLHRVVCRAVACCVVQCSAVLQRATVCCGALRHAVLCCALLCRAVPCRAPLLCAVVCDVSTLLNTEMTTNSRFKKTCRTVQKGDMPRQPLQAHAV